MAGSAVGGLAERPTLTGLNVFEANSDRQPVPLSTLFGAADDADNFVLRFDFRKLLDPGGAAIYDAWSSASLTCQPRESARR